MYTGKDSKAIGHNGKLYNLIQLATAIATAPELMPDPKIKFSPMSFDQDQIPPEWKNKYKVPVLTLIEGQYVFIVKIDSKAAITKVRFVSKFALNKARIVDTPIVDVNKPIYESAPAPVQRPFNPPRFSNTKPVSNGYQGKPKY